MFYALIIGDHVVPITGENHKLSPWDTIDEIKSYIHNVPIALKGRTLVVEAETGSITWLPGKSGLNPNRLSNRGDCE